MTFRETVTKLVDILCDLDEFDTPKEKLPDCPKCGEDELGVIHADWLLCYRCGWKIVCKKADAPPVEACEMEMLCHDIGEAGA